MEHEPPSRHCATRDCPVGHRVAFATAAELVGRRAEAHHAGRLQSELTRLGRYPLIVIDDGSRRSNCHRNQTADLSSPSTWRRERPDPTDLKASACISRMHLLGGDQISPGLPAARLLTLGST
jgi:hypothetical protein